MALYDLGYVKAELRSLQHSLFLVIREQTVLPYRIENRSVDSTMYYRQRGCSGHPWQQLKPGQSDVYSWEEPLKPKRLSVRVGTQNALTSTFMSAGTMGSFRGRDNTRRQPLLRLIKDEEDAVFSAPVTVRLEEIGFREVLACAGNDGPNSRVFELAVDVSGATRVLSIQDASAGKNDSQLLSHLQSLETIQAQEAARHTSLKDLYVTLQRLPDDAPSDPIVDASQKLMSDFPEDPMATRRHQLVVHVFEANGLSTDSFVGSCSPYAEVFMKHGVRNRHDIFKRRPIYRTYYIKKTVNPAWNSQTFTFDVPPEAIDAPRGHSLIIRLRNFRSFGSYKILGKAQIQLHSLRDQKPLVGWFPLAGRAGRQELHSVLSHWGRGSVRASVQWIHSSTSLLNYFILLSEKRLLDLNRSLQGLKQQLKNKREVEDQKQDAIDGFRRVRVHDLVSFSSQMKKSKRITPPMPRLPQTDDRTPKKQLNDESIASVRPLPVLARSLSGRWKSSPLKPGQALRGRDLKLKVEQMIREKNREKNEALLTSQNGIQGSSRPCPNPIDLSQDVQSFTVKKFKYWSASTALFQDPDLAAFVGDNEVVIRLKDNIPPKRTQLSVAFDRAEPVAARLCLPAIAPSLMTAQQVDRASSLRSSRRHFERATRRKTESVLHPGGWLVIRPHAALNLPDSYTGMFVRVSFGPETLVSETVDAKVTPTWNPKASAIGHETFQLGANDMLIHIAPRKTSGFVRLSVFGEKSHPNLSSKTELGVLHLPLGSTISTCIDCTNENEFSMEGDSSSSAYSRWFPLMDPKDVVPVEGDWGLSYRPTESEKLSDSMFKEYFAPCIQLSLLWFPDSDATDEEEKVASYSSASSAGSVSNDSPVNAESHVRRGEARSTSELSVQTYFYADIGRISMALIDSQRAFELLSFSVSDIDMRYWTTKAKTRYALSIGWLQVDQQDDNAREPVVLAPTPMDNVGPVVQALAVKDNARSFSDVVSLDFIDVSIAEFDLTIEESILFDLFDFINSVRLRRGFLVKASRTTDDAMKRSIAGAQSVFEDDDFASGNEIMSLLVSENGNSSGGATRVYIEQLFLGIVKVNLSYLKGKKQAWELTNQGGFVEKKPRGRRAFKNTEVLVNSSSLFHGSSDALMNWAQHTSEDEDHVERKGESRLYVRWR